MFDLSNISKENKNLVTQNKKRFLCHQNSTIKNIVPLADNNEFISISNNSLYLNKLKNAKPLCLKIDMFNQSQKYLVI